MKIPYAARVTTESGDHYLYLEWAETPEEAADLVAVRLGEELAYVSDWEFQGVDSKNVRRADAAFSSRVEKAAQIEYGDEEDT